MLCQGKFGVGRSRFEPEIKRLEIRFHSFFTLCHTLEIMELQGTVELIGAFVF